LAGAGTTVEALKAELRAQLVREKLIASAEGLSIGDQEIRQAFARDKDELGRPEAVHLRHILVDTKAQAQAVVSAVKGGADFRALARERSKAPTGKLNGGDYGFVARGMLPPDIEAIAFSMKPGELRVVPTEKGYHVLQVLARRAAAPAVYAKVKDELGEMLLQRKIKAVLPAYLRELRAKAEIKTPGD
ncbi:MAG: peptidyl-prolyl cis-trans isomerase, partial [Elusimicrobia bacterium]|nr:peptidyl-prolyl cis-trans isomerase [Elusimicrobiota bacterium]